MDLELSPDNFEDNLPPRRKRHRNSYAESTVFAVQNFHRTSHAPNLTFISDNVNGKGKKYQPPLSCCECRRLKLKCDRTFPCASCQKRGCAEICPDGVLVSGKGTRFILANTQQLHSKIQDMSVRIRHLEDALQGYHTERTACGLEVHPLLQPEYLGIKNTMELYSCGRSSELTPSTGVSHSRNSSQSTTDNSFNDEVSTFPPKSSSPRDLKSELSETDLVSEIKSLSHAFPLSEAAPNLNLRDYIRSQLPPREEADFLWGQAKNNALWQYNPHPNSSFYPKLAHHCYTSSIPELSPRRLALMLMILAVGCLVDLERVPNHPDSEKYHRLARASLCEIPVMEDTNIETITVLFYEIWYLLVFSDKKKAAGYAWGLMGLTAKLAQSIDLHRAGGKSKFPLEELESRRSLFWELLYLDARLSLSLGRPPSLSIYHVDCHRPSYIFDDNFESSESSLTYQDWKHSCYFHCLAPVIDAISQPSLHYDTVLDLDRQIRDFSFSRPPRNKNDDSRFIVALSTALEAVLLQLHRQFFTRALTTPEEPFSERNRYAPSVAAVVLSASRLIASLQEFHNREPLLAGRILGYWSNAHSAAVALCLLVYRAPFACLCSAALQALERARILFRAARDTCPRAMQIVPNLEVMINKANDAYNRWLNGQGVPNFQQGEEFGAAAKAETLSRSTHFSPFEICQPSFPQTQAILVPDPFARAHPSLAQCVHDVQEQAKVPFPNLSQDHCRCHSSPANRNDPVWRSWSPPPRVGSPVLSEVIREIDFSEENSPPHGRLQTMGSSNETMPSYFHLTNPRSVYGGPEFNSSFPQNVLRPSTLHSTSSSLLAGIDPIAFELGALNDQNWMAIF